MTDGPDRREEPSEAPWAMQVVLRLERADVPTRTQLCEAAAAAVVTLIADPRSQPGGPWEPSVRALGRRAHPQDRPACARRQVGR